MMLPWFALVGHKRPTGLGIWKQCSARSMTRLACSLCRTPPLWIYITTRCPSVWWAAENTQPCVHICRYLSMSAFLQQAYLSIQAEKQTIMRIKQNQHVFTITMHPVQTANKNVIIRSKRLRRAQIYDSCYILLPQ